MLPGFLDEPPDFCDKVLQTSEAPDILAALTTRTRSFHQWLAIFLIALSCLAGCQTQTSSSPTALRQVTLQSPGGENVYPFSKGDTAWHLFIFLSTECPISNRYAPEISRLKKLFPGVAFWLVYPNGDEKNAAVTEHHREYALPELPWRDPLRRLAGLSGVSVTPEATFYSADGRLRYRGRIDDRYVALGKARPQATRRDLEQAMEEALAGKAVTVPQTVAIGCAISR